MKKYKYCHIASWLLVLLFVNADANFLNPLNIPTYRQIGNNTCWSACLHMALRYYGIHRSEEQIHHEIFGGWRDIPNLSCAPLNGILCDRNSTTGILSRYLSDTAYYRYTPGSAPLTQRQIITEIDNGRPILAGWTSPNGTSIGHVVVIVGYIGSASLGDSMMITYNDPLEPSEHHDVYFVDFRNRPHPDTSLRWSEAIHITNSPHTVGAGGTFPTIQSAINSGKQGRAIYVIEPRIFREQVIIHRPASIRSTIGNPRPIVEFYSTLPPSPQNNVDLNMLNGIPLSYDNIEANSVLRIQNNTYAFIENIDIKGNTAIYNTGLLNMANVGVLATSGYAIYNTSSLSIWGGTTVSSTSGSAIYSTSFVQTERDVTVSAASGYAIHHAGNTGAVNIFNNTVINVASIDDTAIYNSGGGGVSLSLGNNPTINGRIAGFRSGEISVVIGGSILDFAPSSDKKYILAPYNLKDGDIAVAGGARFINHFELTDSRFVLEAVGNNLVARIPLGKKFAEVKSGDTITIPSGIHNLSRCMIVPDTAENVVLRLQPGTEIRFTEGAREIWVGLSGTIIGAENVTLSHQVILYNTPTPREPILPGDRVIGLFSNLCDAIWRGRGGKTIKVGPGIYYFSSIGGQGLIGVMHHERDKSSILRFGFDDSPPVCEHVSLGLVTLIKGMRLEMNGDIYTDSSVYSPVLITYGGGTTIFENCIYEALYSDPSMKSVVAHQLGADNYRFFGRVEYRNSVFSNFNTAIIVNDPMLPEQSPVFTNSIFVNNNTDLRFSEGSRALCGIGTNQIRSIQVGDVKYTGEAEINGLISGICGKVGTNLSVADPGFVDPLISDYRLSSVSPLVGTGIGLEDMGREMIFTFSTSLNGRIDFGQGQRWVEFVNGVMTSGRNIGDSVSFRFTYTLDLRPVYELRFIGSFARSPSEVTVWRNGSVVMPVLPDDYTIWDASVNGVSFAEMSYGEFYPRSLSGNGRVSKNITPNTTAPAPVSGINTVEEDGDVVLTWNRSPEPDMSRYKIFRAPVAAPNQAVQIASLHADSTEFRDVGQRIAGNVYSIIAYDSTGNMSAWKNNDKVYRFSGFNASVRDTLRVTPAGVTVQINNPDYLHGAMVTIRNRGHNDSLVVEWFGVRDQNHRDCGNHRVNLFGNGAQINNIASPKLGNGSVLINLRSATDKTYIIDIEIFNWRNGSGCLR